MTFELKPLSEKGIKSALEKAKHYRLLNEPLQAESICRDILDHEPDNQGAIVNLILSLTDQFANNLGPQFKECKELCAKLDTEQDRAYYAGIAAERRAMTHLSDRGAESGLLAYEWFEKAMANYETADGLSKDDDDLAILRWNTCARIVNKHPNVCPSQAEAYRPDIEG